MFNCWSSDLLEECVQSFYQIRSSETAGENLQFCFDFLNFYQKVLRTSVRRSYDLPSQIGRKDPLISYENILWSSIKVPLISYKKIFWSSMRSFLWPTVRSSNLLLNDPLWEDPSIFYEKFPMISYEYPLIFYEKIIWNSVGRSPNLLKKDSLIS